MPNIKSVKEGELLTSQKWNNLINKVNVLEKTIQQQKKEYEQKINTLNKSLSQNNANLTKEIKNISSSVAKQDQLVIKSGTAKLNPKSGWDLGSPLLKQKNYKTPIISVVGFKTAPTIFYSITKLNTDKKGDVKYWIKTIKLNKNQFQFQFGAWGNATIYDIDLKWIAIGK